MRYGMSTTVVRDFTQTLDAVREALAEQGFGVLTEIDVAATLKQKIDVEVPAQVILGACRPPLAHAALQAEPSIGLLLPCNVVVRDVGDGATRVEAIDPEIMEKLTGNDGLAGVSADARQRLQAALDSLSG
jgi:uncharacterized protein (DUF302 family)